jgi:hypothetical protein
MLCSAVKLQVACARKSLERALLDARTEARMGRGNICVPDAEREPSEALALRTIGRPPPLVGASPSLSQPLLRSSHDQETMESVYSTNMSTQTLCRQRKS